jgi:NAD(P)-dependent dehydrogenase (short-subunit alcohol dehydrogenase family)
MKALITGANRGIGLEYARQLAERGDRVFAACRRPNEAEALNDLKSQYGDQVSIIALEVTEPDSIAASYAAVNAQTDALDLLINNAAIATADGGLGNFDVEVMKSTLIVNAIGPMLVIEQYLSLLEAGAQPKIVNISSGAGSIGRRNSVGSYSYGASKAALNFYTRNLSFAVRDADVIAISLNPGWVRTDMGGPNANIEVEESVSNGLAVIDSLTLDDSGEFFDYTGDSIPW